MKKKKIFCQLKVNFFNLTKISFLGINSLEKFSLLCLKKSFLFVCYNNNKIGNQR